MTLRIRLLLRLLRIRAGRIFVALMVVGGIVGFHVAVAEAQVASNFFIYPFNPAVSKISLAPSARWGLFRSSDSITISTTDNSAIRVLTMDGTVVHFGPPITLQLGPGHYFVECNGDRTQFCVLPNDYDGGNFLGMEAVPMGNNTNVIGAVSPSWLRMLGGSGALWSDVQPQAGTFSWTTADQVISNNAGAGRKLIWVAFLRPSWLTDDTQFISLYTNYVSRVAQRYGSQLYAIEIWNEPWTTCALWGRLPNLDSPNQCMTNWQQMANSYSAVLQAARVAIKSVAPNVRVIGPAWTSPQYGDVTAYLNELGATSLLEALTFHDYDDGSAPPDQAVMVGGTTGTLYPRVDQNLAAFQSALGNSSTPLLADEIGLYGQSALGIPNTGDPTYLSGISWQRGMYRAIKTAAMYAAGGVQAIIPHVLYISTSNVSSNEEIYGYEAGDRGPHPKTSAFLMTSYWLNGATFVNYFTPGTNVFLYAWQLANNTSLVFAWAVEGQTVPLLNTTLAATDIFGNSIPVSSLTEMPVLFHSSSLSASALLATVLAAVPPNVDLPPLFSPLGSQSVQEGQPLQFSVSATDVNLYSLTYAASSLPIGASFNSTTGIFSWTPTTSQVGNYSPTFTANDGPVTSAPFPITISVVKSLFDGLTNYWSFNEGTGTTAADLVGQVSGTLSNFSAPPAGWVAGKSDSALSFDGVGSSVVLPNGALYFTNNFTVTAWLYPRNASGDGAFLSVRCGYPSTGFRFFIANNGVNLQGQTTAGWQGINLGVGSIQNGNWYQVTVVYDKSTITAYANGLSLGGAYWGGDLVMGTNGASHIGTEGSYYFNGIIDEIMFFNRALGSNEVTLLYNLDNQVPAITSLQFTNSSAMISFMTVTNTVTNELYEVDYRNDLQTGTWSILTNGVPGTGGMVSIADSGAVGQSKRFYRVGVHF